MKLWITVIAMLMLVGCGSVEYRVEKKVDQLETKVAQLQNVIAGNAQMSNTLARYLQGEEVVITRVVDKDKDKCAQLKWGMNKKTSSWSDVSCKQAIKQEEQKKTQRG